MIRRLLGISGALPVDASDGLAVALCHLHRAGRPARVAAPAPARRLAIGYARRERA